VLTKSIDPSGGATVEDEWNLAFSEGATPVQVATLVVQSRENFNFEIQKFYTTLLNRQALVIPPGTQGAPNGFDEVGFWTAVGMKSGVEAIQAGILGSAEYFQKAINANTTSTTTGSTFVDSDGDDENGASFDTEPDNGQ
jgi:hypothetical protein